MVQVLNLIMFVYLCCFHSMKTPIFLGRSLIEKPKAPLRWRASVADGSHLAAWFAVPILTPLVGGFMRSMVHCSCQSFFVDKYWVKLDDWWLWYLWIHHKWTIFWYTTMGHYPNSNAKSIRLIHEKNAGYARMIVMERWYRNGALAVYHMKKRW